MSLKYNFDIDILNYKITLLYNTDKLITVQLFLTKPIDANREKEYNPKKLLEEKYVKDSIEDKYEYSKNFDTIIDVHNPEYFINNWSETNRLNLEYMLIYTILYFFIYTRFKCTLLDNITISNEFVFTINEFFKKVEENINQIKSYGVSSYEGWNKKTVEHPSNKVLYKIYSTLEKQFSNYIIKFKKLYSNIEKYINLENSNEIPNYSNTINDPDAIIYCIGDLEGDLDMIYSWFIKRNLLSNTGEWIADKNIYVIQLGDQLDSLSQKYEYEDRPGIYRRMRHPHLRVYDFEVVIFFEYLRYISNNHVISVLGNHDWMQIPHYAIDFGRQGEREAIYGKDTRYKSKNDSYFSKLFDEGEFIYKILMRRPFLIRINNVIGSHAGFSEDTMNGIGHYNKETGNQFKNFDEIINNINNKSKLSERTWYKYVVYPLIWNRHFDSNKCSKTNYISEILGKLLMKNENTIFEKQQSLSVQQVIGHNTMEKVELCTNEDLEIVLVKVDTGYVSRLCNSKTNKTVMKYAKMILIPELNIYDVKEEEFEYNCGVSSEIVERPTIRFIEYI
jgi:hypothetical protein